MQRVSTHDVASALDAVGIRSGDAVMVHSNLIRFGFPQNGVATYLNAFSEVLGASGTLAVPAFSFSFIQSGRFHWADTPSEGMGAFAEAVRKRDGSQRTRHPLQSVAAIGPKAIDLASIETVSAYASDGVFQAMCDLDFKVLLLGADPVHISHSHLSEETCRVPYRFDKTVSGQTRFGDGEDWQTRDWQFFARDLDLDVRPEGEDRIVRELLRAGTWHTAPLNQVPLFAGSAAAFVDLLNLKLRQDILWMAPNRDEIADKLEKQANAGAHDG